MSDFIFVVPAEWTQVDFTEFVARTGQGPQSIEAAENGSLHDMDVLLKAHDFIPQNSELTAVKLMTVMDDYVFLIKFRVDPV